MPLYMDVEHYAVASRIPEYCIPMCAATYVHTLQQLFVSSHRLLYTSNSQAAQRLHYICEELLESFWKQCETDVPTLEAVIS